MENARLLNWPTRSPYLLLTENVFSMVAEQMDHHHAPATTVDELLHQLQWAELHESKLHKLHWHLYLNIPSELCLTKYPGV
ncbi:hypothetical protein TNCV_3070731 [Trichonephila clavipes]|nr:hypothetical protein TNCV_3070731 [Trichonephila clavipes]